MKFFTPYLTSLKRISAQLGLVALASVCVDAVAADEQPLSTNAPLVYVNKHIGFNVKGFKYTQKEYPCHIDEALVEDLIEQAKVKGIRLESVGTIDKIRNGVVPVLAIDIEKLVLGERKFGIRDNSNLPMVEVTAALVKGKDNFVTAKHSCAFMTLSEFSPSDNLYDMGAYGTTVCSATKACLKDLSKDVVEWIAPQIK